MSTQKARKTSLSAEEQIVIKNVQKRTRARTELAARNIENTSLMERLDREQDADWALIDKIFQHHGLNMKMNELLDLFVTLEELGVMSRETAARTLFDTKMPTYIA